VAFETIEMSGTSSSLKPFAKTESKFPEMPSVVSRIVTASPIFSV